MGDIELLQPFLTLDPTIGVKWVFFYQKTEHMGDIELLQSFQTLDPRIGVK